MTTPAVLLDIDGTLVDSNYLHVQAWSEALSDVGHPVDDWLIHRAIGMDSAKLLGELLGGDADRVGERAKRRHEKRYAALMPRLRPFDGARDLLRTLAEAEYQVVLATSAPQNELEQLLRVLESDDWIAHVTSGDDVDTAKPDPEVVQVALDRAGVGPESAVMVGDTGWDGQAAGRVGVPFIGVRTGGVAAAELRDGGAVAVYRDVAELLASLPDSQISRLGRSSARTGTGC